MVRRAGVLEGSLAEFDLRSVVAVVSTSKRLTGVELTDDSAAVVGTLFVKADRIVAARMGALSGRDAVHKLVTAERAARFFAFRISDPGDVKSLISVSDAFASIAPSASERPPPIMTATEDDGLDMDDSDTEEELLVMAELAEPRRSERSR